MHTNVNHPIRRLRRHLPYLGKVDHLAASRRQVGQSTLERGDVAEGDRGEDRSFFDERAFRTKVHTNVSHPIRRLRRHLPYLGKVIHPIRPSGTFSIQGRFFIPSAALADGPFRGRLTFRRLPGAGLHFDLPNNFSKVFSSYFFSRDPTNFIPENY